ncbi:phospholipase A1-like [Galleria mellonella]|uniref:Phospholipase A1-like n=1 Tax=Galleria mellonella TaxID=7137 RepID=A0A6J1WH57_GALME|nr:phospholipase A1-like [Galleria mellonella]
MDLGGLLSWIVLLVTLVTRTHAGHFSPRPDTGYALGYLSECPGSFKNASISPKMLQELQIIWHRWTPNGVIRNSMPITSAAKSVLSYKVDFKNKKTVLYVVGYLDSSTFIHNIAVASAYAKRGYNVFVTESISVLPFVYPRSVRISRAIGKKLGEFIVQLTQQGLKPDDLELVGFSLGSHMASYAAKYYYAETGRKPSRLTGLDPSGPCFRGLPATYRLSSSDAERVDAIHTNIDGFGIAEALGHVDVYINGGEYQPGDIPYIPCLVVCSHMKVTLYWWQAVENPKKFIAVKCDSIQDARLANCYNNTVTNYVGIKTDFKKPGIYYLSTSNEFPYYQGKDGLKAENEIYWSTLKKINADDNFVVKK